MINPWENFELSPMGLCEEPINAWIRTPANTWSNFAFVIVGIFLLVKYKRQLKENPLLKIIPIGAIIAGVCSFIYHASYSFELLILDIIGMWVILSFIISMNFKRLFAIQRKTFWFLYLCFIVVPIIPMLIFKGGTGSILFCIFFLLALLLEIPIRKQKHDVQTYKYFFLMIAIQMIAAIFWVLDQQGIICNPQSHFFQGHMLWHMFNAISMFFLYKHYEIYFKGKGLKCF